MCEHPPTQLSTPPPPPLCLAPTPPPHAHTTDTCTRACTHAQRGHHKLCKIPLRNFVESCMHVLKYFIRVFLGCFICFYTFHMLNGTVKVCSTLIREESREFLTSQYAFQKWPMFIDWHFIELHSE